MLRRFLTGLVVFVSLLGGALSHAAFPAAQSASGMVWYLAGFELGPWEAYLARKLTPEMALVERVEVPEITWMRIDHDIVLPEFAQPLIGTPGEPRVTFLSSRVDRSVRFGTLPGIGSDITTGGFQRSVLLSGLSGRVNDQSRVSVSAVLASQQFSHSMLDVAEYDGLFRPVDFSAANRELSQGAGLELGFASELLPRLQMNAIYRSRINMDELATIRGVHGQAADLDIPSRLRMGLDLQASDRTLFTVAVAQVFYSQVGAFPSRALPARFNALLGDSSSPRFEWNDLTVYSLGMRWQHESDLEFKVDFHTRSQPRPTSPSLVAALDNELAQHSLLVGLGKRLGERARIDLSASYAPPEFAFGGNVLGIVSERLDQAVEISARFNLRF